MRRSVGIALASPLQCGLKVAKPYRIGSKDVNHSRTEKVKTGCTVRNPNPKIQINLFVLLH